MTLVLNQLGLTTRLTPHGHLTLEPADDAPELDPALAERLDRAFSSGAGHGLLRLGAAEIGEVLPPVFAYWRELGGRYVTAVCTQPDAVARGQGVPPPAEADLRGMAAAAPVMPGAEYLTADVLRSLWEEIGGAFSAGHAGSKSSLEEFLKSLNPAWNLVGRVYFNLAENRTDDEAPFAFLATYTHRLSAHGKARHLPLGEALKEYAGAANRDRLLSLLLPVQRATERCAWLREMVDAGEIFHPLRWRPEEAFRLLGDAPERERAGVIVRMPAAWKAGRPARPQVTATIGGNTPAGIGADALLDFQMEVTLDGERLTAAELKEILARQSGLAMIRGRWVEVEAEGLERMIDRFREAGRLAAEGGLTFGQGMRLLAGADVAGDGAAAEADRVWSSVVAGPWLAGTLKGLRSPEGLANVDPGTGLHGTLRPYQETGLRWLHLLTTLGLGACLADDMGLGKTIQVLALLLVERRRQAGDGPPPPGGPHGPGRPRGDGAGVRRRPSLLVAPASLLANWADEINRFAPDLRAMIAHPSAMPGGELKSVAADRLGRLDLVITSYGTLLRTPWIQSTAWRLAILDEAQAIKNPGAQQTRAVKKLDAGARIALTGTPVENRLGDLWSIFDFINPGLLGSAREFTAYARGLQNKPNNPYGPLRDLVRPYILRRLKTDRSVIADLPDKTEVKAFCPLARKQAALYQQAVDDLAARLRGVAGIRRKGLVLAFLMRFKQICNHPSHWLGDGAWLPADSGKWARLRELSEVIAARQEKALIFTQFREMTEPLASFLGTVFGRAGLVLHGDTEVRKRRDLVMRFQADESVPFFVLSLKAGGSGLNLTAASHVVHFDRWWNPAVEDQATDRAFRIGQTKNVLVHKFVCRGTVEEKIDSLIESKKRLSRELLEGGAEVNLTEMGDEELLGLVALDLKTAMKE